MPFGRAGTRRQRRSEGIGRIRGCAACHRVHLDATRGELPHGGATDEARGAGHQHALHRMKPGSALSAALITETGSGQRIASVGSAASMPRAAFGSNATDIW